MDKFLPIRKMKEQDKDCKVPTNLVPRCPRCHEVMEVNLRKDDTFVEDAHWHTQNERYEQFLNHYQDRKLVLMELGVGWNTPGIIRIPFEELTNQHSSVTLIRVNQDSLQSLYPLSKRLIATSEDCCEFLRKLVEY